MSGLLPVRVLLPLYPRSGKMATPILCKSAWLFVTHANPPQTLQLPAKYILNTAHLGRMPFISFGDRSTGIPRSPEMKLEVVESIGGDDLLDEVLLVSPDLCCPQIKDKFSQIRLGELRDKFGQVLP